MFVFNKLNCLDVKWLIGDYLLGYLGVWNSYIWKEAQSSDFFNDLLFVNGR